MNNELCEYEILFEMIGAHAGEGRMQGQIIEAELSDLEEYVRENDDWPVVDTFTRSNGDVVYITKSGEGNIRKYTFMKC